MTKKKTIEDYKKVAESKGGKYILDYIPEGVRKKVDDPMWECGKCKYQWSAIFSHISRTSWCPDCSGTRRKTLKDYLDAAKLKNGKYLLKYIPKGVSHDLSEMMWECKKCQYQWSEPYHSLMGKKKGWCPKCERRKTKILNDYITLAESKDG